MCFCGIWGDGHRSLPSFRDLQYPAGGMPRQAVFLFRVDKEPVFLLDGVAPGCRGLRYLPVCGLKGILLNIIPLGSHQFPA